MNVLTSGAPDRLNNRLARLLVLGTWTSCGFIMIGMALPALGASPRFVSADFVSIGIVLLIALPTVRVATMAVWFLFNDDRDFALIAALVLAIIVASTLLGAGAA
jgi:sorbitol-specific phosphotransferase system component IIBC